MFAPIGLLKDCLFPIFCLGCDKEGEWVCAACLARIDTSGVSCCPVCHRQSPGGQCCPACEKNSSLSSLTAVTPYDEAWLIGRLIHALKYSYASDCFSVCRVLLDRFLFTLSHVEGYPFSGVDMVVPIPLHARRSAERGFNQAELVADVVAERLQKSLLGALKRTRYTERQARLKRPARIKNVQGAFCLIPNNDVVGKCILLVDDVYTTGSTMQECARVLRLAGALDVRGFTLARG